MKSHVSADQAWAAVPISAPQRHGTIECPKGTPIKQCKLAYRLQDFWTPDRVAQHLLPYTNDTRKPSKRMIEWALANWAQDRRPIYITTSPYTGRKITIDLYSAYKNMLKKYRRRFFGPIRRGNRVLVHTNKWGDSGSWTSHTTTIGQLVFFRWAYEEGVMDFICKHTDDIQAHEEACKTTTGRKKRTPYVAHHTSLCCIVASECLTETF